MSRIINELNGKLCKIDLKGATLYGKDCTVLDSDEEFIKVRYTDIKKKVQKVVLKIVKIEDIESIQILD